jgi:hypothetical protein
MPTGSDTRTFNTTISAPRRPFTAPAPLVALAGWLVPGLGYILIGERGRGIVIGVTIIVMFVFGLLLAGVRVIDVPGYNDVGRAVYYKPELNGRGQVVGESKNTDGVGRWALLSRPVAEIANKPWFVGQVLAGPMCLIAAHFSLELAHSTNPSMPNVPGVPRTHARLAEFGTLYTAIAGMLNLLAIIDASYRVGLAGDDE